MIKYEMRLVSWTTQDRSQMHDILNAMGFEGWSVAGMTATPSLDSDVTCIWFTMQRPLT